MRASVTASLPLSISLARSGFASPDLWAKFDQAQKRFGKALAGDSLMAIAQAFGDIAQAVTDIADEVDIAAASQAS